MSVTVSESRQPLPPSQWQSANHVSPSRHVNDGQPIIRIRPSPKAVWALRIGLLAHHALAAAMAGGIFITSTRPTSNLLLSCACLYE